MNKPDKRLRKKDRELEIVREGDSIIMRRIVDPSKFRRSAAEVLARMPKPKKGESIAREIAEDRRRGWR